MGQREVLLAVLTMTMLGCAGPAEQQQTNVNNLVSQGYSETRLQDGSYWLRLDAKANTAVTQVEADWHRHAAKLCNSTQYTFVVDTYLVPGPAGRSQQVNFPLATGRVRCSV